MTIYERVVKFYSHLLHLRASNAIIDNALLECSMLHDKGAPSLLSVVLHLLRISGHSLDSLSRESATSRNRIPLSVSRSLKTLYEKMFRDHIQESGRLSEIYQFIKKGYGEESYVNNVSNYEHRAVIAKFRISAHFLPIEIGRMQQIPRSQRTCTMCTGSQLGNEVHFILRCSEPRLVEARDEYFDYMVDIFGCERGRVDKETLLKMLGNTHIVTNTATIMFLIKVLGICKDLQADNS